MKTDTAFVVPHQDITGEHRISGADGDSRFLKNLPFRPFLERLSQLEARPEWPTDR